MSILDRVTKAVGDVVDRGKKEVDQFVRIQKINGQIGDLEKNIGESNGQIQQIKVKIGERAIDMLQAGTLGFAGDEGTSGAGLRNPAADCVLRSRNHPEESGNRAH